jgi:outer membrane protein TolC
MAKKIANAQKLIDAARAAGFVEFTVGAGTGNTLHTVDALIRAGYKPVRIGGVWQSKGGMQYRMEAAQ